MSTTPDTRPLSLLLISLMKGILHADKDPLNWQSLLRLQGAVRDHVSLLGLELVVDESEGFAWLRQRESEGEEALPSLVSRRPLSYPVSLLLVLLRRRLAEHDSQSGETRLILSQEEIVEMLKVFLPTGSNEAKLADQIESHLRKASELGFVRELKASGQYEVPRVLKAFVDAQWLGDFEARLESYRRAQEEKA